MTKASLTFLGGAVTGSRHLLQLGKGLVGCGLFQGLKAELGWDGEIPAEGDERGLS